MQAGARLGALAADADADGTLRMEALTTIGALKAIDQLPIVQDLITDDWPALRAAAIRAAAIIDPDNFTLILSGLEIDRHWMGRAALADALGSQPAETALPRLTTLLKDEDKRVIPHVLRSLVRQKAPEVETILFAHLKEADYVIRETAAELIGEVKPAGGLGRAARSVCRRPARRGVQRASGGGVGDGRLRDAGRESKACARRWPTRTGRCGSGPRSCSPSSIRPAITGRRSGRCRARRSRRTTIRSSPRRPTSPHVFIDTDRGTIEFELAVLDAPQTARSFIALARKGFFNGLQVHRVVANFVMQDGDPRGDGEGGPGYTIRDEPNERPYLRGTVGMALSWKDTGGSQFFITHSPQPHLDGQYTAFGHVVNGMDVVDRVRVGDTIKSIRIWDGKWLE